MWIFVFITQLITVVVSTSCRNKLNFLPMPASIQCNQTNLQNNILHDPCTILYHIQNSNEAQLEHFKQIISDQQLKTFHCSKANIIFGNIDNASIINTGYKLTIQVNDSKLKSAFKKEQESYSLNITKQSASLRAQTYVGIVRGLQTFLQSFQCPKLRYKQCIQRMLPLFIQDKPAFIYRGLMVDTSRHFLPINLLYETIDAMMYNKLNVFHWHITDEDSFPLILESHPEIAQFGAFSEEETYSSDDARDLVRYAMVRGIRIVPELDTPGHAASWGKAQQNKGISCTFGNRGYMGPIDVTLDKTYKLIKQVFAEIIDIFPDPIIHLGGDEVALACQSNMTEFVAKQRINSQQIELQYRRKQRKIIKQLEESKIPMYWMNGQIKLQEGDIVHWWGQGYPATNLPVVISNYGPFYLDMGVGNYFGDNYGNYITWLQLLDQNIAQKINSYQNKNNVLGAEVCLWSEVSNKYTHHMKIWIRSSSFAQRLWNDQEVPYKPGFLGRLTAHERLMNRRGIPTAPATCQQCETHPEFC